MKLTKHWNTKGHVLLLSSVVLAGLSACSSARPALTVQSGKTSPAALVADSPAERARMESEYTALVDKIRKDPHLEDVKRLREAYVRTERYQPYGADGFLPQPMLDAMDAKSWADCRAKAQKALDRNYMDLNSHLGAMVCNRDDGRKTEAAHHQVMLTHLIAAILATGDGKSEATAFETYYTHELYAFLGLNGLETISQALSDKDGRWFDVMQVKDTTGKVFSLYFDITWQRAHSRLKDGNEWGRS